MAEANQISCPHCGQPYFVRPEQWAQYHGRTINCTKCARPFVVTAPAEMLPAAGAPGVPPPSPPDAGQPSPFAPQQPYPPAPGGYPQSPAGYPSQYPPYPPQTYGAPSTNGWAVTSLVSGIMSFCIPVLGSLVAIITGILGIAGSTRRRIGGKGMAVTGLVLGLISTLFWLLAILALTPAVTHAREVARRAACASNERQIGSALLVYAGSHGGRFPDKLEDVLQTTSLPARVFVCPDDDKTPPSGGTPQMLAAQIGNGKHCSYVYVGAGLSTTEGAATVVLYEPLADHRRQGMNVLFADGSVKWVDRADAQRILHQRVAGVSPIRLPAAGEESP